MLRSCFVLLTFLFTLTLAARAAEAAADTAQKMFPFVLPWDDSSESVANVSGWLEKPAGRDGFVRAENGHLVVTKSDGTTKRMRLLGVNLCFGSNFLDHATAEKVAARMAKFGINCVRFHHMDKESAPRGIFLPDGFTLDPAQLDKLDYFIAQLKERGIYADLNLKVSRTYPEFKDIKELPRMHKGVDLFNRAMIDRQKQYARDLLTHVNPYTKLAYVDDPAVAIVEINNENGLISTWWEKKLDALPEPFAGQLRDLWTAWLTRRYESLEKVTEIYKGARPFEIKEGKASLIAKSTFSRQPEVVQIDWMRFLWETEAAYWREMTAYLKTELKVRSLLIGTQLGAYSVFPIQQEMDVVDVHTYWKHPDLPTPGDYSVWSVGPESMLEDDDGGTVPIMATRRVAGKPYVCTEYNHVTPNPYGAEGFLLGTAYAALQDFDGLFAFAYSHYPDKISAGKIPGFYDIDQHPLKMATLPIAAALFVRGDVKPAVGESFTAISLDAAIRAACQSGTRVGGNEFGVSPLESLRQRTSVRLAEDDAKSAKPSRSTEKLGAEPIVSDTKELKWTPVTGAKSVFSLETERSRALLGFSDGKTITLGTLTFEPKNNLMGWSVLALAAMTGEGMDKPGRYLLVACGKAENTAQVWKDAKMNSLKAWGHAPSLVEGVEAAFRWKLPARSVKMWALDEKGARKEEVPVNTDAGGLHAFAIGPQYRTIWYEIEILSPQITPPATAYTAPTAKERQPVPKGQELFPFVLPWNDASPGVTDYSSWNATPAGKSGFVRAQGEHLVVDQDQRIKFFGVNFSFAANFPAKEEATQVAARLARFGINAVRFHHMDLYPAPRGIWQKDIKTIDPAQLDRLDFLFSQLKAKGIYGNINLHVSRTYPDLPPRDKTPRFDKGLDLFMPQMIELQKDYARQLLLHKNPYTGLRYVDDPAVAFVEINNENSLFSRWWEAKLDEMPSFYAEELTRQWAQWKTGHAPKSVTLPGNWISKKEYDALPKDVQRVWVRFLCETERDYWREMRRFLKEDLGVKAVVVGSALYSFSGIPLQMDMDAIDIHAYWSHPEFPDSTNRNLWYVINESMVNHPDARTLSELSLQRVAGKPLIVTEYNHSTPNTYGAEAFPLVAAYGAMQDWDAIFVYSYAHGVAGWDSRRITGQFDIDQHPLKMATLPLAVALFRRGDVKTTGPVIVTDAGEDAFLELYARHGVNIGGEYFGVSRQDALRRPQALRVVPKSGFKDEIKPSVYQGPITSDSGELTWDAKPTSGLATINTPRTKVMIGHADNRAVKLGAVTIEPGPTRQQWSMIGLTSKESAVIGQAGSSLLVACGDIENTKMGWVPGKFFLSSWGVAPTLVEGIPAEITIQSTCATGKVWALDDKGQRQTEVPVRKTKDGFAFTIQPAYRTIWYEVFFGDAK